MATTPVDPGVAAPGPKTNRIGLTVMDYKGGKTTLCAGCGHNAISERIIESMYEMGVQPELTTRLRSIAHITGLPLDARSITDELTSMEGK
jgi:2-oxoglutarate/2-oxoacid ferredoxin oxidoreductase subunit beta